MTNIFTVLDTKKKHFQLDAFLQLKFSTVMMLSLLFTVVINPTFVHSQNQSESIQIKDIIDDNGYINAKNALSGSINLSGYAVQLTEKGPKLSPSLSDITNEDYTAFTSPDPNGTVRAIAVDGSLVYVGGEFKSIGNVSASNIAVWDGTSWSSLGTGMNGTVRAILVDGSTVYVGGDFSTAGGVSTGTFAKWNGTTWSNVGGSVSGGVYCIVKWGTDIYISGNIFSANGVTTDRIAKYNGSSWSALGSGAGSHILTMAVYNSNLYVGGSFNVINGDNTVYNIARWDGSTWHKLGNGTGSGNDVVAMTVSGGYLYVGGKFTSIVGTTALNIARFDGTTWSALGSGVGTSGQKVHSIAVDGSTVYAGGEFTTASGATVNYVTKWDGSNWSALDAGVSGGSWPGVFALGVQSGNLFVGGTFSKTGTAPAYNLVVWNGTSWDNKTASDYKGLTSTVRAIASNGKDVYVGGDFTSIGATTVNYIAKWDGTSWSALGTGMNSTVYALEYYNGKLYAGGNFSTAGGTTVNRIASWDGTSWSALGSGIDGTVHTIAFNGSNVYAGGNFYNAGGSSARSLAVWNGTTWSQMWSSVTGGGFFGSPTVYKILVNGNDVYIGGLIQTINGVSGFNGVGKWNGSAWSTIGSGTNNSDVRSMAFNGTDLYISGNFSQAGGNSAAYIAKWNGSTWSALGSGLSYYANALISVGSDVYAFGEFSTAGGISASRIAKWDGSAWSALGSGANNSVNAANMTRYGLFFGGSFTEAGGAATERLAFLNGLVSVSQQFSSSTGFRLLGTPVATTYADLLEEVWTQGATGADATTGSSNVWTWNNSSTGNSASNWTAVTDLSTSISGTNALLYYHFDDKDFNGRDLTSVQFSVSGAENEAPGVVSLNSNANGWSLVGNPFSSAVNWNLITDKTNIQADARIWNPTGDDLGSWTVFSGSQVIEPLQAFFVQTSSEASASINITSDAKTEAGTFLGKQSAAQGELQLQLKNGAFISQPILRMHPDASFERDRFDGDRMMPLSSRYVDAYFVAEDGRAHSIEAIPLVSQYIQIPLHVEMTQSAPLTLSLVSNNLDAQYQLEILDLVTGIRLPIDSKLNYTFEHTTVSKSAKNNPFNQPITLEANENALRFYVIITPKATSTTDEDRLIETFTLHQNYPNPFNPSTTFSFKLAQNGPVQLTITNMLGQEVATVVQSVLPAGSHTIQFDASALASGVYMYRLTSGGVSLTRKMTLLK